MCLQDTEGFPSGTPAILYSTFVFAWIDQPSLEKVGEPTKVHGLVCSSCAMHTTPFYSDALPEEQPEKRPQILSPWFCILTHNSRSTLKLEVGRGKCNRREQPTPTKSRERFLSPSHHMVDTEVHKPPRLA